MPLAMTGRVLAGIDELLSADWGGEFTFDREKAEEEGIVILKWEKTNQPIPMPFEISEAALEKGRLNWREIHRKIKDCLAINMFKAQISEANILLRNANRRTYRDVERDFHSWLESTAKVISKIRGVEDARAFLVKTPLPAQMKSQTIQSITYLIETKIDELRAY